MNLTTGHWTVQAIFVAAKLGIADLLRDGAKSSSDLLPASGFRLTLSSERDRSYADLRLPNPSTYHDVRDRLPRLGAPRPLNGSQRFFCGDGCRITCENVPRH